MMSDESDSSAGRFRPLGPVIRAEEAEKWLSAAAFLTEARQRASQIAAEAQLAFEQERARGFEAGRLSGVEQAARLIGETKAAVDEFISHIHDELIALVVEIIREIVGSFEPDDLAARAVARALEDLRDSTTLMLVASPEQADSLRARLDELVAGAKLSIIPDPQLAPGQCMLWSEFGRIEASVDAQLEQVAYVLEASLGGTRS